MIKKGQIKVGDQFYTVMFDKYEKYICTEIRNVGADSFFLSFGDELSGGGSIRNDICFSTLEEVEKKIDLYYYTQVTQIEKRAREILIELEEAKRKLEQRKEMRGESYVQPNNLARPK